MHSPYINMGHLCTKPTAQEPTGMDPEVVVNAKEDPESAAKAQAEEAAKEAEEVTYNEQYAESYKNLREQAVIDFTNEWEKFVNTHRNDLDAHFCKSNTTNDFWMRWKASNPLPRTAEQSAKERVLWEVSLWWNFEYTMAYSVYTNRYQYHPSSSFTESPYAGL